LSIFKTVSKWLTYIFAVLLELLADLAIIMFIFSSYIDGYNCVHKLGRTCPDITQQLETVVVNYSDARLELTDLCRTHRLYECKCPHNNYGLVFGLAFFVQTVLSSWWCSFTWQYLLYLHFYEPLFNTYYTVWNTYLVISRRSVYLTSHP